MGLVFGLALVAQPISSVEAQDAGNEPVDGGTPPVGDAGPEDRTSDPDAGVPDPDAGTEPEPVVVEEPPAPEPEVEVQVEPEPIPEPTQQRPADAATQITGRVVDASTGDPLIEATVIVEQGETRRRVYTDDDGNFAIEVPPGLWVVRAYADLYREARHRPIRVRVGQHASVTMRLREGEDEHLVYEVVETADTRGQAALDGRRMEATTAQDSMGAQTMQRTGSSNAARAASRVVGASLDGNTLIVRGLGDRYTNVLMNGVQLPGTDPDRNGVQLDVIPAAVIANIAVIKTFQPEIPANWAGGLMVIESQAMPERFEVRFSGQLGYNSTSTFRHTLAQPGSGWDAIGFGASSRALPSAVPSNLAITPGVLRPDGTQVLPADTAVIGRAFSNRWDYSRRLQGPTGTLQFSIGNRHELPHGRRFGYLAGVSYQRSTQVRRGPAYQVLRVSPDGKVQFNNHYQSEQTIEEALLTGFGTASFRYSSTGSIRALAMYTQHASEDTQYQSGFEGDTPDVQRWQMQYVQRSVLFTQLIGEQGGVPWWTDEPARIRYSAYFAQSRRYEPGTRQVRYARDTDLTDPLMLSRAPNSADVLSLDLHQRDFGGYVHLNARTWSRGTAELGVDTRFSDRASTFRQFHFTSTGNVPLGFLEQDVGVILDPANIQASGPMNLSEITSAQNNYVGNSRWIASYLTTDTRLTDWFRVVGGVRMESMHRAVDLESPVEGIQPVSSSTPSHVARDSIDFLPAASVIVSPNDRMNVRFSYGATVVHPQFREFAPTVYYDFSRRRNISGNASLVRTRVQNLDLRWEWLQGENGLFAVSAFYKHFDHPIERVNVAGQGSTDLKFENASGGFNVGTELEARFNFGQWDERESALDWFSFNGNVSLVYSRVQLTAEQAMTQARSSRPMFLQSPYVANLSLGFDHPGARVSLTASYNVVGPRIVEVGIVQLSDPNSPGGPTATPNVIERPFHSLDAVGGYEFDDHWRLTLTVRNLLRSYRAQSQGATYVQHYTPGTDVLVGIAFVN